MLKLIVGEEEFYNEETEEFDTVHVGELELEHSLISLSKWESKHKKPFLSSDEKTPEETLDYVRMMIVSPNSKDLFDKLSQDNLDTINEYIQSSESATTFGEMPKRPGHGEVITAELIYYWMVAFTIPFECEDWHLNRLFALIRICNIKNQPQKKMSRRETAMRNRELNEQRRAKLGTRG
jgi:hypothetical protein